MEFTHIPLLENRISRVGLGTWAIGGWMWGGTDEENAIKTIHKALDMGINLIDTAPVYGFGKAEEVVGKALKHYGNSEKVLGKALKQYGKRENIIIATKVGLNWKDQKIFRDSSKKRIIKEIEDSLNRLQVDYIDLYQVHWPDAKTPIAETAEVLAQLLKEGKIRAIGVSNYSADEMETFRKTVPIQSAQPPFNLFERDAEQTILAYCKTNKIATLGYGSLCRGLLSGKMRPDTKFEGDDLRKSDPKFQPPRYSQYLECVKRLDHWSQKHYQRSVLSLAIRWVLDKGINVALWGARQPEQLNAIATVWGWKLKPEDFKEIDDILSTTISMPVGPEFMAPPLK
jgi:aryl-alcohol dehydrogenase-like predicted oxidoreductase